MKKLFLSLFAAISSLFVKRSMTFQEFVMSQPDSRSIDHRSWQSCAIGDYYREVYGKDFVKRGSGLFDYNVEDYPELIGTPSKVIARLQWKENGLGNYGQLKDAF